MFVCHNLRDTCWQHNRSQNRGTGLKSSPSLVNSAISTKSLQNARLGSCGASSGKMSPCRTPDLKIIVLASNHRQIGKTVPFLQKVQKRTCGAVWSMFWQNLTLPHTRSQNRVTGLKSSPNRENTSISTKSVQNARLGPCGASFGKISLCRTLDLKIVELASNHRQIVKTVRFLQKVYNTHV